MAPELSIVIPVHNESPNIKPLYDELTQTLVQYGRSYELIVVDDGSTDDSFEQLSSLQSRDPQPADLVGDRRAAARLRLLAESVPRRGRQAAAPLWRDAPVHAGDRQPVRREDRGDGRQPSPAPRRRNQVRHRPHDSRAARS